MIPYLLVEWNIEFVAFFFKNCEETLEVLGDEISLVQFVQIHDSIEGLGKSSEAVHQMKKLFCLIFFLYFCDSFLFQRFLYILIYFFLNIFFQKEIIWEFIFNFFNFQ